MSDRTPAPPENPGYETTDFHARPVIVFGVSILVLMGLTFLILIGAMKALESLHPVGTAITPITRPSQVPPDPRLEVEEGGDLAESHRREDAVLNHYGWVDKNAGRVHIPIDRAIDILAGRGLPARTGEASK